MKIAKKAIRFIVELLLTIVLIAYILIQLLSSTILNENYVIAMLGKTGYCEGIYEIANSKFENYIDQSGLDESVMDNILSEEKIKEDTLKIISNIYEGEKQEISTQEIRDNLENNIKELNQNKEFSATEQEAIDLFINEVCEEYKVAISHTNLEEKINNILVKMIKYIDIAKIALLIFAIVLVIIIIALNMHHKYRIFSDIGIALFASGSILILFNLYINLNIDIKNIIILNQPISNVVVTVLQEIFGSVNQYGLILAILGMVLIIVPQFIHNKYKYK